MSTSSFPPHRFDVSVIIPVEFHRGQAVDCVRGWTQEQDYPGDRYQIILCAPHTLKPETEAEIRSLLRPWDRLEKRLLNHDMPLVAEAARLAESELLLFTESHCLPETAALGLLLAVASEHPEWSGFSCQTTPITHNLLSEIEAEIYVTHIRHELESSGWLKVVDQCFLVRREAYFEAGGFRPSFGHFAEWLLAAEMHRLGKVIGFCPHTVIRHYYIGEVNDLESFTIDFARGQIKYLVECKDEPTSAYFPEIPELQEYCRRSQADYRWIARVKTAALPAIRMNFLQKRKDRKPCVAMSAVLVDWLESAMKGFDMRTTRIWAVWSALQAKHRLLQALRLQDRDQAKVELVDWFVKLVHLGRLQYLMDNPSLQGGVVRNPNYPISGKLHFNVVSQGNSAVEWQGFFDSEETFEGCCFRWSQPTACVWLPLHEGCYRVIIEWDIVRSIPLSELLCVNFDGQPVVPNSMKLGANSLIMEVVSEAKGWHRLDWTVVPFHAKGDRRLLGLPITTIHWFSTSHPPATEHAAISVSVDFPVRPVYFLHVFKCAGTSLRLVLDNAYHSSAVMAPYGGRYYTDDLQGIQSEPVYAYYRGHFRWALPAALSDQNWKIVTILRDPVDRILSRFYYEKQLGHIHADRSFAEWFEHDLTFANTMSAYFLSINSQDFCKGGDAVRPASLALLGDAQANLQKCLAVGVFDRIEDSVNLFAWHLGFLAPKILPKNNPTLARLSVQEITDALRARIEEVLEADMTLYRQAQQQFQTGLAAMFDAISPALAGVSDTVVVRDWLRQRYVDQMAQAGAESPDHPTRIDWIPDDIFHGENLHERELCEGKCLRWTGPNTTTNFYYYLGRPRDWELTILLHPATPREHVVLAQLTLNGFDTPVQIAFLPSGEMQIVAHLTKEVLSHSWNGVADFALTTPVIRGEGEFRMLGVALKAIVLKCVYAIHGKGAAVKAEMCPEAK